MTLERGSLTTQSERAVKRLRMLAQNNPGLRSVADLLEDITDRANQLYNAVITAQAMTHEGTVWEYLNSVRTKVVLPDGEGSSIHTEEAA